MEIVKTQGVHKFIVKRAFMYGGKAVQPAETIEIKDQIEADGYVQRGLIVPADIPKTGVYVVVWPSLVLPGLKEKFEAKKLELVELTQDQAIELMLSGAVIPKSQDQWRPRNMHLRQPGSERKEREQRERLEQGAFEQKLWEQGIHPGQKRK